MKPLQTMLIGIQSVNETEIEDGERKRDNQSERENKSGRKRKRIKYERHSPTDKKNIELKQKTA